MESIAERIGFNRGCITEMGPMVRIEIEIPEGEANLKETALSLLIRNRTQDHIQSNQNELEPERR